MSAVNPNHPSVAGRKAGRGDAPKPTPKTVAPTATVSFDEVMKFVESLGTPARELSLPFTYTAVQGQPWFFDTDVTSLGLDADEIKTMLLDGKKSGNPAYDQYDILPLKDNHYVVSTSYQNVLQLVHKSLLNDVNLEKRNAILNSQSSALDKWLRAGKPGKVGVYNRNEGSKCTFEGEILASFSLTVHDFIKIMIQHQRKLRVDNFVVSAEEVSAKLLQFMATRPLSAGNNAVIVEVV